VERRIEVKLRFEENSQPKSDAKETKNYATDLFVTFILETRVTY